MNKRVWAYAAVTFVAITIANLLSIRFGDELYGWRRVVFLGGLIAAGGMAAYILTVTLSSAPSEIAEVIAKASMLAFMAAETVDAIVYQVLHRQKWAVRANLSNLPAAAVDSVVFAWVAFDAPWSVGGAQFFAKVIGGFVWVFIIGKVRDAAAGYKSGRDAVAV